LTPPSIPSSRRVHARQLTAIKNPVDILDIQQEADIYETTPLPTIFSMIWKVVQLEI
jgi:hypothetical protein